MTRSRLDSSIEMEFLVGLSDESPYFSHFTCKMLLATYVVCKSYKRKRSIRSVTTIFELSLENVRFRL